MPRLARHLSLIAVIAGALCSVIGGGINVLIVDIQNQVPGIGSWVPFAMLLAGSVALLVSLTYAIISTAMPRAGGEYVYVSRGLSPGVSFVMAFVKWLGIVISIGVIAYMDTMVMADSFHFIGLYAVESFLRSFVGSVVFPLFLIWVFLFVHVMGVKHYGRLVTALALVMFIGGFIIIGTNLMHNQEDFSRITGFKTLNESGEFSFKKLFYASTLLFWAFIGFTSVAQAGGEIESPEKNLPRAFILTSILVTLYYFVYSFAFYHAIPWQYIVGRHGLTVPGLTGLFLPGYMAFVLSLIVTLTLANDIPPMLLTSSRLLYSWAVDGIMPKIFAETSKRKVPVFSLLFVAVIASLVVIESAVEGFFLAVNVVTISRFLVYMLVALALLSIEERNRKIYERITFLKGKRWLHLVIAFSSLVATAFMFGLMAYMDVTSATVWYEKMTFQLVVFVFLGVAVYYSFVRRMKKLGVDYRKILMELPEE